MVLVLFGCQLGKYLVTIRIDSFVIIKYNLENIENLNKGINHDPFRPVDVKQRYASFQLWILRQPI